jgi:hypothetical protein
MMSASTKAILSLTTELAFCALRVLLLLPDVLT